MWIQITTLASSNSSNGKPTKNSKIKYQTSHAKIMEKDNIDKSKTAISVYLKPM